MTVQTLKKLRSEQAFELFWLEANRKAEALNVPKPKLPRRRKCPKRFEYGSTEGHFNEEVKPYFCSAIISLLMSL